MSKIERLEDLERLQKVEGQDLALDVGLTEADCFTEAEARIDQFFFTKRRLKLIAEMPLPPGSVDQARYDVIKSRESTGRK